MHLKEICESERPREKLLANGPSALDNSELLAILLRTGTGGKNVVEIASELLRQADNSLTVLSGFSLDRMTGIRGIGYDKAATLSAALELGKRFISEKTYNNRVPVTSPEQIFRIMQPLMKGLTYEECWIFFLNRSNFIISKEKLSSGGMNSTVLDTRIIIRRALERQAHGLILVHNHPSGNPRPGQNDIRHTESLKKAAATFDISLLDHLVIADDRFYSFSEGG